MEAKFETFQMIKTLVSNIFSEECAAWLDIHDEANKETPFLCEEIAFHKPPEEKVNALNIGLELLGVISIINFYRAVGNDRSAGDFVITLGGNQTAIVWFDYFT